VTAMGCQVKSIAVTTRWGLKFCVRLVQPGSMVQSGMKAQTVRRRHDG
jgi:hypothetical protein